MGQRPNNFFFKNEIITVGVNLINIFWIALHTNKNITSILKFKFFSENEIEDLIKTNSEIFGSPSFLTNIRMMEWMKIEVLENIPLEWLGPC